MLSAHKHSLMLQCLFIIFISLLFNYFPAAAHLELSACCSSSLKCCIVAQLLFHTKEKYKRIFLQTAIYEQLESSFVVHGLYEILQPVLFSSRGDLGKCEAGCFCSYENIHPLRLWNVTCPLFQYGHPVGSDISLCSRHSVCLLCLPPFFHSYLTHTHFLSHGRRLNHVCWKLDRVGLFSVTEVCTCVCSLKSKLVLIPGVSLLSPWKRSADLILSHASENNQSPFHEVTPCHV